MEIERPSKLRTSERPAGTTAAVRRAAYRVGHRDQHDRRARRRSAVRNRPDRARPARARARPRGPRLARRGARRRGCRSARGHRALARRPPPGCRSSTWHGAGVAGTRPSSSRSTLQRVVAIPSGSRAACSASRSPTRETSTASTSSGSRPSTRSTSASRAARTSSPSSSRMRAPSEVFEPRRRSTSSRSTTRTARRSDDLEVDDGVSDAPLVRLVNSIIMQAADRRRERHPLRAAGGRPRSCACASTACSTRCSGSRSGWRTASRRA